MDDGHKQLNANGYEQLNANGYEQVNAGTTAKAVKKTGTSEIIENFKNYDIGVLGEYISKDASKNSNPAYANGLPGHNGMWI